MQIQLKARLKALAKRGWHLILIAAGVFIPLIAALSDSTGELGRYGGTGIVAIALIGVATTVSHTWHPPESSVYKRAFAIFGTLSNAASPLLTFMYTRLPSTTKGYLLLGTAAALAGSLKGAFGARLEIADIRVEKLAVNTTEAKVEQVKAEEAVGVKTEARAEIAEAKVEAIVAKAAELRIEVKAEKAAQDGGPKG